MAKTTKTTKKTAARATDTAKTPAQKKTVAKKRAARKTTSKKTPAKKAVAKKKVSSAKGARKTSVKKVSARKASVIRQITVLERHRMIAEAAYLRGESLGFLSDETEDWLIAETEIDTRLSKAGIKVTG